MARVRWNQSLELALGYGNAIKITRTIASKTQTVARTTAPLNTGSLAKSIDIYARGVFPKAIASIGVLHMSINVGEPWRYKRGKKTKGPVPSQPRPSNADVLVMHHKGINLIAARNKPMLRFQVGGRVIRTQYTVGYKADPFLVNAFKKSCPYPVVEYPI